MKEELFATLLEIVNERSENKFQIDVDPRLDPIMIEVFNKSFIGGSVTIQGLKDHFVLYPTNYDYAGIISLEDRHCCLQRL